VIGEPAEVVHQEVHAITIAATISGPLRPAANMKPKCPSSWLPRVKLTRLRFIRTSLAGGVASPSSLHLRT
jgi:hypothetical protein